jgi:hypothetical protein
MPGLWFRSALVATTLLAGCLPRPQFKVRATDIGSEATTLLARVWLGQTDTSVNLAGGMNVPASQLTLSVPVNATAQIPLPSCTAGDCTQRQYAFGVDFPSEADLVAKNNVALLGLAAVSNPPTDPPSGCVLGLTSALVPLTNNFGPETATLSFIRWAQAPQKCIAYKDTPFIASVAFDHTRHADTTVLDIMTIDGWNFVPNITVKVVTGCNMMVNLSYSTQKAADLRNPDASKILYVTPSRIVAQLAQIDILEDDCAKNATRSVSIQATMPDGQTVEDTFPM